MNKRMLESQIFEICMINEYGIPQTIRESIKQTAEAIIQDCEVTGSLFEKDNIIITKAEWEKLKKRYLGGKK